MGIAKDLFSKVFGVNENSKSDVELNNSSEISISYSDDIEKGDLNFLKNTIGYFRMAGSQKNAELISKLYIKDNNFRKWTEFRNEVKLIIPYYDIDILELECDTFRMMAMSYSKWQQ